MTHMSWGKFSSSHSNSAVAEGKFTSGQRYRSKLAQSVIGPACSSMNDRLPSLRPPSAMVIDGNSQSTPTRLALT